MKNHEFQEIVLDKLRALDNQQKDMSTVLDKVVTEQASMSTVLDKVVSEQERMKADIKGMRSEMKEEFKEVKRQINSIVEQTANLLEFKTEVSQKLKRNIG